MPPFYEYRQSGCYAWLAFFLSFAGSKAVGQATLGGFDFAPVIFLIIVKISKVKTRLKECPPFLKRRITWPYFTGSLGNDQ